MKLITITVAQISAHKMIVIVGVYGGGGKSLTVVEMVFNERVIYLSVQMLFLSANSQQFGVV